LRTYHFRQELDHSRQATVTELVTTAAREIFGPDVTVEPAGEDDDRTGVDYWAILPSGRRLGVDLKLRRDHGAAGDVALEMWSVMPGPDGRGGSPGWPWDPKKRTDYVIWIWLDTRTYYAAPYPLLHTAFLRHARDWTRRYRTARQSSGGWTSQCVFVPIDVLDRAIAAVSRGRLPAAAAAKETAA